MVLPHPFGPLFIYSTKNLGGMQFDYFRWHYCRVINYNFFSVTVPTISIGELTVFTLCHNTTYGSIQQTVKFWQLIEKLLVVAEHLVDQILASENVLMIDENQ